MIGEEAANFFITEDVNRNDPFTVPQDAIQEEKSYGSEADHDRTGSKRDNLADESMA